MKKLITALCYFAACVVLISSMRSAVVLEAHNEWESENNPRYFYRSIGQIFGLRYKLTINFIEGEYYED